MIFSSVQNLIFRVHQFDHFSCMCSFAEELTHLREKVKTLEEHEAEFGQKRAKFKEIYMQKESMNHFI